VRAESRAQNRVGGTGDVSLRVDVLDAQQPPAAAGARIEKAANGRHQRAEVEPARRRWGETVGDGAKRPQQAVGRSPAAATLLVMAARLSARPCARPTAPGHPSARGALVFAAGPGKIFWSS